MHTRNVGMAGAWGLVAATVLGSAALATGCGSDDCRKTATCPVTVETTAGAGAGATTSSVGGGGGNETCIPMSTELCYSGPEGTEDVGLCQGGTRTCSADGTWGPCEGEVVPSVELCATVDDENCDGFNCVVEAAAYPAGDGLPNGVTATPDGGFVMHGLFGGTITFGSLTETVAGATSVFTTKFSSPADPSWLHIVTVESGFGLPFGSGTDGDGRFYLQTAFSDPVDLGDGTTRPAGAYVTRFTSGGDLDAALSPAFAISDLHATPDGHVVVVGTFDGTVDFGEGPVTSVAGSNDIVIAKLTPDLEVDGTSWIRTYGASEDEGATAVDVGSNGTIVVGGRIGQGVDFGDGSNFVSGDQAAFIAQFTPEGTLVEVRDFDGPASEGIETVNVTATGSVIFTLSYQEAMSIGGVTLEAPAAASTHTAIVRLEYGGTNYDVEWVRPFPGLDATNLGGLGGRGARVALDGGVLVAADLNAAQPVQVGDTTFTAEGTSDALLFKMDGSGNVVWARRLGAQGAELAIGLDVLADGTAILVGSTEESTIDLGTGPITVEGGAKAFYVATFGQ